MREGVNKGVNLAFCYGRPGAACACLQRKLGMVFLTEELKGREERKGHEDRKRTE